MYWGDRFGCSERNRLKRRIRAIDAGYYEIAAPPVESLVDDVFIVYGQIHGKYNTALRIELNISHLISLENRGFACRPLR